MLYSDQDYQATIILRGPGFSSAFIGCTNLETAEAIISGFLYDTYKTITYELLLVNRHNLQQIILNAEQIKEGQFTIQ